MNQLVVFWIIAAVVLAVVELITAPLVCIWLCGGAIVAAVVSVFTDSLMIGATVFLLVSALLLLFTRPLVKRKITPNIQPTNADRIIGMDAVVIEQINTTENKGKIKVEGQVWSAKSSGIIQEGEKVTVSSIEGVKAVVKSVVTK